MQPSITERMRGKSFWLSILLHLFLLILFCLVVTFQPSEKKKSPHLYVPSYVYKGAIKPSIQHTKSTNTQVSNSLRSTNKQSLHNENEKQSIEGFSSSRKGTLPKSLLAATYSMLQQEQFNSLSPSSDQDPIYLIGDENYISDPLIKMVGRALSAHFEYPKMAGEFGIKGRTILGMTLHPEGYFTDVQMLESSGNEDLDAAALRAVNSAPRVMGADRFLSKPKRFVIGFVFRLGQAYPQ